MEVLKEYIEQLQNEAFERGFKMAIEQGQKHGHWIDGKACVCGDNKWICSACGEDKWMGSIKSYKYCPYCGAKMDEVNHESDKEQQISECEGNLT